MASARSHVVGIIAEKASGVWVKRAFYITGTMLLLAVLNATVAAQNPQEPPSDPCEARKQGCVTVEYDRFKDKTFVTMTPIFLTIPTVTWVDDPVVKVAVGVSFSSSGNTVRRPETVTLIFIATVLHALEAKEHAFANSKSVDLLIDGKPYPLGEVSLEKESPGYMASGWEYSLRAPFEVIEKITSAKMVEIRAGSVETTIDEKVKAPFRRLIKLVPKEERAASPAVEKAAPREVKRPKSTRPVRRRRP
jgi:hypothetical protein